MNKKISIGIGTVLLAVALIIGIYINQSRVLPIEPSDLMLPESTVATDILPDNTVDEIKQQLAEPPEAPAAPVPLLEEQYEQAMTESDLSSDEIEEIRKLVNKGQTFEEALQSVRPGSKVVEEQVPSNNNGNSGNTNNTQKPTTPTKPSNNGNNNNNSNKGNGPSDSDYKAPDNRNDQQKQADDPANDPFNGGSIEGGNIDHEPEL